MIPIQDIAQSDNLWSPSEDFTIEQRKLNEGNTVEMYFHTTLYDNIGTRTNNVSYDKTMNRGLSSKIPNLDDKISNIWKKYLDETNGEEWVRYYVENLPRTELLQYLFEIDYLNENDLTTCGMRYDTFENFINRLEILERENDEQR